MRSLVQEWSAIRDDFSLVLKYIVSVNWHCSEASLNSAKYCQAWLSCFCMRIFICVVVFLLILSVLCDTVCVGQLSSRTRHRVPAVAALDKSLSMV